MHNRHRGRHDVLKLFGGQLWSNLNTLHFSWKDDVKAVGCSLFSVKPSSDALVAKTFGITHLDDPIPYITSEQDILLMTQNTYASAEIEDKLAAFHEDSFPRNTKAVLDELHLRRLKQDKEQFPNLVLFLDT